MEHEVGIGSLLWPVVNFLVLVGILVYNLRAPLKDFVKSRHNELRETIEKVREMLADAKAQYDDYHAKLQAVEAESTSLKEEAVKSAEKMRSRIVTEAQDSSSSMVNHAKTAASSLYGDLKEELRTELAVQVLNRAEGMLVKKLTGDDRARIRREFSRSMEGMR